MLPLLLFHKAFCLLQFRFSYASANFSFKGIIGGLSTTFNFSVSFFKLHLYCPCCVFCVSVCRVFLGYKSFAAFKGAFIVLRLGDEVVGRFWDTPRYEVIPLGLTKLPSPRFLGFVTGGLSNLQRGISFVFQGSFPFHYLKSLKLIPLLLFVCL